MFKFNKKGDAAILVIIIAIAILLYILFLPPGDRAKLLDDDGVSNGDSSTASSDLDGKILLSEKPGRLDNLKQDEFNHEIGSFTLFSTTESGVLKELDSLLASRSVFNSKDFIMDFEVMDKDLMDNFILSFVKKEGSGILTITLNDKILSEKFIESANPAPIRISKDYLVNGNNRLVFSVSSPGILFFMTNRYSLENIKIFADSTDNDALRSTHSFVVSDIEFKNIEDSNMVFFVDCMDTQLGKINVKLNQFQLYDSAVDCGNHVPIDINPVYIRQGDNILSFEADKGKYLIDQLKVRTFLKEPIYPVYYFEITDEELELIQDNYLGINLSLTFVEKDREYNQVELNINNRKITVDTIKEYNEEIDLFIQKDNNFIKISPMQGTIDIADMTIYYWDKD